MNVTFPTIAVIGAGAMGRGIAQIAAQAGSRVHLVDNNPDASAQARAALADQWDKLVAKGKLEAAQAQACKERLQVSALSELADCDLVIEAIVERLDIKRALFAQLEDIVAPTAVLASNTSSLSITALAAAFISLHRFRPDLAPTITTHEEPQHETPSSPSVIVTNHVSFAPGTDPSEIGRKIAERMAGERDAATEQHSSDDDPPATTVIR